ncbi:MAG: hypothetical protein GX288_07220 [Clostridiales bacterium]|nr:hypothetical protein [Clostridiales bacterium]
MEFIWLINAWEIYLGEGAMDNLYGNKIGKDIEGKSYDNSNDISSV